MTVETKSSEIDSMPDTHPRRGIFRSVGPALIVACVVLGPGSILTSSKVGCQFGYQMVWILVAAGLLMLATVATAARVGVVFENSPCTELARRLGRPLAILVGLCVFAIAACFQFSNNLGVLMSVEPLIHTEVHWQPVVLIGLNLAIIACLFGFRRLYQPIEQLMVWLVGLMLLGFAANLVMARPSLLNFFQGLIPGLPPELSGGFLPQLETAGTDPAAMTAVPRVVDPWLAVQGLVATTFSIAGAFYQAYLVKEKDATDHFCLGRDRTGRTCIGLVVVVFGLEGGQRRPTANPRLDARTDRSWRGGDPHAGGSNRMENLSFALIDLMTYPNIRSNSSSASQEWSVGSTSAESFTAGSISSGINA